MLFLEKTILQEKMTDLAQKFDISFKKLVLAKPERVFEISGFYAGGVPPFAMLSCEYRLVCDSVLDLSYVIRAGGHPYLGIEICTADLLKISGIKVSRISQNIRE